MNKVVRIQLQWSQFEALEIAGHSSHCSPFTGRDQVLLLLLQGVGESLYRVPQLISMDFIAKIHTVSLG